MSIATDELQRLLFDHIADAVVVLAARSPEFPIIEVNQAYRELLGDPDRPLVGEGWRAAFPEADGRDLPAAFAEIIARGEPFQARDVPHRHPLTGATTYWDWRCLPLRDAFGLIDRLVVILADATDRQQIRRVRLINRRIAAETALSVLVTRGPDHRVVLISPPLAELGAQPAERLVGRAVADALPALAGSGLAELMSQAYDAGQPFAAEEFSFAPTGDASPRVWNLTIMPLPGLDGAIEGLTVMAADLTAQVRARRETAVLAVAAQRRASALEAVFAAIADGLFLLDGTGRVIEANEAGRRLLDLPDEAAGRRLLEVLVGLDLGWEDGRPLHTGDALLAAACTGQRRVGDLVLVGVDPSGARRFLSLTASPVAGADDRTSGAVVLVRDVTAQKAAEREKDAFLSLVAHEVKSPLTAIKGFAQLARRAAGEANERAARHLGVIEQQAARIGRLVDELTEVNRLHRGTLQIAPIRCDLAALARAAVEVQGATLGSARIALNVSGEPLPIHADPARIEQVIANLLLNAAKYSPDDAPIAVSVGRAGAHAALAVRDRGIGIPPDELGRIFDRFYRAANGANRGLGGLGLGLFISREIVARSGGELRVASDLGAGSTFTLTLPLADGDQSGFPAN